MPASLDFSDSILWNENVAIQARSLGVDDSRHEWSTEDISYATRNDESEVQNVGVGFSDSPEPYGYPHQFIEPAETFPDNHGYNNAVGLPYHPQVYKRLAGNIDDGILVSNAEKFPSAFPGKF